MPGPATAFMGGSHGIGSWLPLLVAALHTAVAHGRITLPSVFGDGMVLQDYFHGDSRSFIYGYADANEAVAVNTTTDVTGQLTQYTTVADGQGYWIVQLNPDYFVITQPQSMTIVVAGGSDGYADRITIRDVVYGDVFLCSGQSNMDFAARAAFNVTTILAATYPNIRLFAVAEGGSYTPQRDVPRFVNGSFSPCWWWQAPPLPNTTVQCNRWVVAQPGVTDEFSAVCFLTAWQLTQISTLYANRTVGLIFSAVGGTAIRMWSPPEALAACNSSTPVVSEASAARSLRQRRRGATAEVTNGGVTVGPFPEDDSTLFNAMIAPLQNYALRAVLWYQGEADSGQPAGYYACHFAAMIEAWRRRWKTGDYAFLFVQLAPQVSPTLPDYSWFQIRREQATVLPCAGCTTDTTGMVPAYDLGDVSSPYPPDHVHPRYKLEVARRMALQVLHVQWALQYPQVDYDWPRPVSFGPGTTPGTYTIAFSTSSTAGIRLSDTTDCWECCSGSRDVFQLATTQAGPWINVTIPATSPTSITLAPVQPGTYTWVRYAANTFPQCAVYASSNAIPAAPFLMPLPTDQEDGRRPEVAHTHTHHHAHVVAPPDLVAGQRGAGGGEWTNWKGRPIVPPAGGSPPPPMGFNSWNAWHCNVDESLLRKTADVLVSSGLAAAGYTYVNVDDCWQASRSGNGTILEDPARFPSGMAALSDYIHGMGLKFGIYTAQAQYTCQWRPGSYSYEALDAATYCRYGVDYLKIDQCNGQAWPALNTSWILFHNATMQCGHPILTAVSSCSDPTGCGAYVANLASVWRTTADIQATWASVLSNLDDNDVMAPVQRPGHYNDADMLQVGNAGLTLDQQRAHFAAWAVIASPLLIATELVEGVDADTYAILSAPEVIAVSQDGLQVQGVRVSPPAPTGVECWARPLMGGRVAALLLNRGTTAAAVTCTWQQLGLAPTALAVVRDLWARANIGNFTTAFTAHVNSTAAMLVSVAPV